MATRGSPDDQRSRSYRVCSPRAGFGTCQRYYPDKFWTPALQTHPNGSAAARGVVLVADNPTDHHIFLKAFTGISDLHASSIGNTARTENGDIEIMEGVSYRDQ